MLARGGSSPQVGICHFSTKECEACGLDVPESRFDEHVEDVCLGRKKRAPALLREDSERWRKECALVTVRALGSWSPLGPLILSYCLGTDSWLYAHVICPCCRWRARTQRSFTLFRFDPRASGARSSSSSSSSRDRGGFTHTAPSMPRAWLEAHMRAAHSEPCVCSTCGLEVEYDRGAHQCEAVHPAPRPWLADYEVACHGCGATMRKSAVRGHVCAVPIRPLFGLADGFHAPAYQRRSGPWLDDYEIMCWCNNVIRKSQHPHHGCLVRAVHTENREWIQLRLDLPDLPDNDAHPVLDDYPIVCPGCSLAIPLRDFPHSDCPVNRRPLVGLTGPHVDPTTWRPRPFSLQPSNPLVV